jgi:hypothetical protein
MAGLGQKFVNEGYQVTKPLIQVLIRQSSAHNLKTLTDRSIRGVLNWDAEKYRTSLSKDVDVSGRGLL